VQYMGITFTLGVFRRTACLKILLNVTDVLPFAVLCEITQQRSVLTFGRFVTIFVTIFVEKK